MLIAGPNLTIDRTLAIAELRPGEVLRFDRRRLRFAGAAVVAAAAGGLGSVAIQRARA